MVRKLTTLLVILILALSLTACRSAGTERRPETEGTGRDTEAAHSTELSPPSDEGTAAAPEGRGTDLSKASTLVVYFSWSGNTEEMAAYIAEQTGADLLKIEPLHPYPDDYTATGNMAKDERDRNDRPGIANLPDSIEKYDSIFIGYPIWWHTVPMIIGTFLEHYDLSDVEIYPFTQSASMDTEQFENSMEFVRSSAANAAVHEGLFTRATNRDEILAYLSRNGFME